jgi:hypothetical protein
LLAGIRYVNYEMKMIGSVRAYSMREIFYLDIFHLNARTPHLLCRPTRSEMISAPWMKNTFHNNFREDDLLTAFHISHHSNFNFGSLNKFFTVLFAESEIN